MSFMKLVHFSIIDHHTSQHFTRYLQTMQPALYSGRIMPMHKKQTNWHEAAVCAIQITLRDYEHLLEYLKEYPLGKNAYRIDLLVIRKCTAERIPHSIARIFQSYNLFEIKGVHSSVTVRSYYKTVGYASLLIAANEPSPPYSRRDISISFLCRRNPLKLFNHLTKDCKKTVADPSSRIYYIGEDIYPVQVIVSKELPPEEALYLPCLTDRALAEQLAEDYSRHLGQQAYETYMNQLTFANKRQEGDTNMAICCEGIFALYGTSSKEIAAKAVAPVKAELDRTSSELSNAQNQIEYLQRLLEQHGIAYHC